MNSKIIFGITGSIAAYKACEIIRALKKKGFDIYPLLTKNARKFISPLTIETLSENPLLKEFSFNMEHLEKPDIVVIAPATANIIGKMASGIADSLITSIALAMKSPIIIAPAMNEGMYLNPITQRNIKTLKEKGIIVIGPDKGALAKGEGIGRLSDVNVIVNSIASVLERKMAISSKKVLITGGGTIEPIDPIRFISNRSSGIMAHSLASRFSLFGAKTIIVTTTDIPTPSSIERYNVETAIEMKKLVDKLFDDCDIFIGASAVCDFKPKTKIKSKIKDRKISLSLTRNPDILKSISKRKGNKTLVGFSVDTENRIENAKKKLIEKKLDLIVLALTKDFGKETINPVIIYKDGNIEEFPCVSKIEFADILIERIIKNEGSKGL